MADEPTSFRAGDTLAWTRTDLTDYPATLWTLKYWYVGASGYFSITASAEGTNFSIAVSPTISAGYAAGFYKWEAKVSKTGYQYTVDSGTCTVLPNLTTISAATDLRSHAKKMLDAIESLIEGRSVADVQAYSIGGRSLQYMTREDLVKWREYYLKEYQKELNAEIKANGGIAPTTLKVKF